MATKQTENSQLGQVASYTKKIDLVFNDLPDEFTASELYKKAGLSGALSARKRIAMVLSSVYKCTNYTGCWKKPKQSHLS